MNNDTPPDLARAVPRERQPPPLPQAVGRAAGLTLTPTRGDSVAGSGRIEGAGSMSFVTVSLIRAHRGHSYEGSIRSGECRAPGPTVASLFPVTADSVGSGRAMSDVSLPVDSLLSQRHVIVYGRGGRNETCGALQ